MSGSIDGGAHTTGDSLTGAGSASATTVANVTGGITNVENITGAGTFTGSGLFDITGADTGTVNFVSFTGYSSLQGTDGSDDTFQFAAIGSISGTVDGGTGTDTLDYTALATDLSINLQTGAAPSINGGLAGGFSGIETLNSGLGNDTLIGRNAANAWSLNTADAGTINGTFTFTGVENLTGGISTDAFTIQSGATLTGSIDGAAGTDTLVKVDGANTWNITVANSGTVDTIGGTFSNMENLTGGTGTDDFILAASATGAGLTGSIDGGAGLNSITHLDGVNSWSITSDGGGTVTRTGGFSNIANLTGGSGVDTFTISSAHTGIIDAGAGNDILNLNASVTGTLLGGAGDDLIDVLDVTGTSVTVSAVSYTHLRAHET